MVAVSLLQEAEAAGLSVCVEGDRLVVRGPKSAGAIAERLLDHKTEVLKVLADRHTPQSRSITALSVVLNGCFPH